MTDLLAWLSLLLPLTAAVGITLFTLDDRVASARLSIGAVALSFLASIWLFRHGPQTVLAFHWLAIDDGHRAFLADFGIRLDSLSLLTLMIVTGVGTAIHIYSYGYMREDPSMARYFAGLSLFMFSMIGIVLADNFLMLFICWEMVGISSYLLIGFWYDRSSAADAAKKAFLTNRLGDFGFLLGIILVWSTLGSLNFGVLARKLHTDPTALGSLATAAGLLIFCGAVGKSAQFPLHVWLPDAMEGPTPVSALIHAATMVAAGVYMLCRVFFLLALPTSLALPVIAWVGGITALLAALMAIQQNDIKRILAYSTLSQLGYMVMAVGLSGGTKDPSPAMFHLSTHAFFKALLFLGSGSVIYALHHEQDIWKMGHLARRMKITFVTFTLAALALCGVPPLSGFYSKDEIIGLAWRADNIPLYIIGTLVAALTAFYMFRLIFVAFIGPAKSQAPDHAHESPPIMTIPLIALVIPTILAGFWGIREYFDRQYLGTQAGAAPVWYHQLVAPFAAAPLAATGGLIATLLGIVAAYYLYRHAVQDPLPGMLGAAARWMRDKFYFDEFYEALIQWTQERLAMLADFVDRWIIAGAAVRGVHGAVELGGRLLRLVQTGNVQTYAFVFAGGVALLLYFMLMR